MAILKQGTQTIRHKFHTPLVLLLLCHGVTAWAQNVTTLTPTPFAASGYLTVDAAGNIFVANSGAFSHDPSATEVYKVTPAGEVSLFADGFAYATGNTFDSQGNLYQSSLDGNRIDRISPDGVVTQFADSSQGLSGPVGLTFDSQGNLFVANCEDHSIRKITPGGDSTSFFSRGSLSCPSGLTSDNQDNLYITNFRNNLIIKLTPAGVASVFADTTEWTGSAFGHNADIIFANERLYVAGGRAQQVFELSLAGELTVLAGTGDEGNADGPLLEASFLRPSGIDVSPDGRLLYTNTSESPDSWTPNVVRVIELSGFEQEDFQINPGLNDAWFNKATNGQGVLITVFPDIKQMFLAWFTYDVERPPEDVTAFLGEPGHRWLTAQGPYEGDTATLTVFVTEGGVFDSPDPVAETDLDGDGTMILEFADCENGLVNYHIASLDISGEFPIERIAPDNVALCETLGSP